MGSETLLSMQKFIEQEGERQEQKTEIDAKQGKERRKTLQQLFQDFEDQLERELFEVDDRVSVSSTEVEEHRPEEIAPSEAHHVKLSAHEESVEGTSIPIKKEAEPQLYICDDWIMPVEVMKKPCLLQNPQNKPRASVAKNFLLVLSSS